MLLRQIFDPALAQYSYLIGCQKTGEALLIDPERDIERYLALAKENELQITAVAETHIHADFVSGAREFSEYADIHLYLSGEGGSEWSYRWTDARPKTHLLKDGDHFMIGNIRIDVLHTPGHTPEHLCFLITDLGGGADEPIALASGDLLFVGDVGRPDLLESAAGMKNVMEPSARALQATLANKLTTLSDYLQILPAHGAGSACGKSLGAVPTSTLGYERRFNHAFKSALTNGAAFVRDILIGQPDPPHYFATMKRVNRDGIAVTHGVPLAKQLSVAECKELSTDARVRILDTRIDRVAFEAAHIEHAINAPLGTTLFCAAAGSFINEQERIVLVVERTEDVDHALDQLYRIGFDHFVGWISVDEATRGGLCTSSITRITFSEVPATTEKILLDVRKTSEYREGHIEGALSIPYTRLMDRIEELQRDMPLYVHCASGRRAGMAASYLCARGYQVVHVDDDFDRCVEEKKFTIVR